MRSHMIGRAVAAQDVERLVDAMRAQAYGGSDPAEALWLALFREDRVEWAAAYRWADRWLNAWAQASKPDDVFYHAMRNVYVATRYLLCKVGIDPEKISP